MLFVWGFVAVRVSNNTRAQLHQHAVGMTGLGFTWTKEGYRK